jgi:hypothetical protein
MLSNNLPLPPEEDNDVGFETEAGVEVSRLNSHNAHDSNFSVNSYNRTYTDRVQTTTDANDNENTEFEDNNIEDSDSAISSLSNSPLSPANSRNAGQGVKGKTPEVKGKRPSETPRRRRPSTTTTSGPSSDVKRPRTNAPSKGGTKRKRGKIFSPKPTTSTSTTPTTVTLATVREDVVLVTPKSRVPGFAGGLKNQKRKKTNEGVKGG